MKFFVFSWVLLITIGSLDAQTVKDYKLRDLENQLVSLYDLKGERVTVIDFWATWCKPCKKAIPELNVIYERFKEEGVEVVGINCDGPRTIAKVPAVSRSMQIQYPVLLDINSDIPNAMNISSFPTLLIIDENNEVKYYHEGFVPGDEEEIVSAINDLLGK